MEFLVVIAIIALVSTVTTSGLLSYKNSTDLSTATQQTYSLLLKARSRTLSSDAHSQYGVHFQSDRVILFKGTSYAAATTTESYVFPASVEMSSIQLNGGGADIIFKRLTGETNQYGTTTLRLKANTSRMSLINVKSTGNATIE
jgi:type II secretory pathway pseudopilin PulG